MSMEDQYLNGKKQEGEAPREETRKSALESINEAFALRQQSALEDLSEKGIKPIGKEKQNKNKQIMKWNIISGCLVGVILLALIGIVVVLNRGTLAWGTQDSQPPVSATIEETGNKSTESESIKKTPETESARVTEKETSKKTEKKETEAYSTKKATEETEEKETVNIKQSEKSREELSQKYSDILSQSEKKEWKEREVDTERVFIQLNQKIKITDPNKVYLRLVNPPYSAYSISVKVYMDESPEQTLYQSELLAPGTIQEYVSFTGTVSGGSHNATIEYSVVDGNQSEVGVHKVDVTIEGAQ